MDNIEATDKVLSISSQCCLLGISRSQYYYQPSLGQQEKDFKLLVEIKRDIVKCCELKFESAKV